MKLLFIGDVIGDLGLECVEAHLPQLKSEYKAQLTIVNGENTAKNGRGINSNAFNRLLKAGADVVTLGNHSFADRKSYTLIEKERNLLRPINYPKLAEVPGRGLVIKKVNQSKLAIINIMGQALMPPVDNPFLIIEDLLDELEVQVDCIFIDFHAESTSEKQALAWHFDGKVSAIIGTHTHVQTNDAKILPKGTGYLTDVGMTGGTQSVIGMEPSSVIDSFRTKMPNRFDAVKHGPTQFCGCLIDIDEKNGHTNSIQTIYR